MTKNENTHFSHAKRAKICVLCVTYDDDRHSGRLKKCDDGCQSDNSMTAVVYGAMMMIRNPYIFCLRQIQLEAHAKYAATQPNQY